MKSNTIAVLPFINRSSDPENGYFCDGVTEEIINGLAAIEALKVTSRTSSFFFKGKEVPVKEIATQLDVAYILEGSIRLAGNKVRITAQLIEAEEDFQSWSETWDRQLDDIFQIQAEISLLIADKLREQLGHFEIGDNLVPVQTQQLDAYQYSLKAKFHFNKWNFADVGESITLYEKALAMDPKHTESLVGLADAYSFMATTEFIPPAEAWQKSREYTQRAYDLNPKHAGVHYQKAQLAFFLESDYPKAVAHTARAIELKPNYPEAQQFMALWHMIAGRWEEAKPHLQKALSIDPLSKETLFFKALYHYRSQDYEEALRLLEACFIDNPNNIPAYVVKGYCLLKLGLLDEALNYLAQIPEERIVPGDRLGITCLAYILKGDLEQAEVYLAQIEEQARAPMAFQAHVYLFLAYVNLEAFDQAFAWLEKTVNLKSPILLLNYMDPLVEKIMDHERYDYFKTQFFGDGKAPDRQEHQKAALLDEATAKRLHRALLEYIEAEQPFLDPTLSLRSLARRIKIHPNQLSWLINTTIGQNFNTFINQYRVEYFKELAVDPANAHISLMGLAFESGFNSKTAFNTFFKKTVGLTPKAYVKANQ